MYEVRRDPVTGEDVPVHPSELQRFRPQPVSPPPAPAGQPVYVRKSNRAEPMTQKLAEGNTAAPESARLDAGQPGAKAAPQDRAAGEQEVVVAPSDAATARLCGDVRDPLGRPVAGARVVLRETGVSSATDGQGHFCLESSAGARTLAVMAVGFHSSEMNVQRPLARSRAGQRMGLEPDGLPRHGPRRDAVPDAAPAGPGAEPRGARRSHRGATPRSDRPAGPQRRRQRGRSGRLGAGGRSTARGSREPRRALPGRAGALRGMAAGALARVGRLGPGGDPALPGGGATWLAPRRCRTVAGNDPEVEPTLGLVLHRLGAALLFGRAKLGAAATYTVRVASGIIAGKRLMGGVTIAFLKIAKVLGIKVPPSIAVRADRVIE